MLPISFVIYLIHQVVTNNSLPKKDVQKESYEDDATCS